MDDEIVRLREAGDGKGAREVRVGRWVRLPARQIETADEGRACKRRESGRCAEANPRVRARVLEREPDQQEQRRPLVARELGRAGKVDAEEEEADGEPDRGADGGFPAPSLASQEQQERKQRRGEKALTRGPRHERMRCRQRGPVRRGHRPGEAAPLIDELGHSGPALLAGEGRRIGRDAGGGIASLGQKRPDGVWRADDEPCCHDHAGDAPSAATRSRVRPAQDGEAGQSQKASSVKGRPQAEPRTRNGRSQGRGALAHPRRGEEGENQEDPGDGIRLAVRRVVPDAESSPEEQSQNRRQKAVELERAHQAIVEGYGGGRAERVQRLQESQGIDLNADRPQEELGGSRCRKVEHVIAMEQRREVARGDPLVEEDAARDGVVGVVRGEERQIARQGEGEERQRSEEVAPRRGGHLGGRPVLLEVVLLNRKQSDFPPHARGITWVAPAPNAHGQASPDEGWPTSPIWVRKVRGGGEAGRPATPSSDGHHQTVTATRTSAHRSDRGARLSARDRSRRRCRRGQRSRRRG